MSPIYSILVFVCIFNAINAASEVAKTPREICIEMAKTGAEECRQESGISHDEIHSIFTNHEFVEGGKGKEFMVCYASKIGLVVDEKYRWNLMKQHLGTLFGIDALGLDKIETNCKNDDDDIKVTPERILAIGECVETEIVKLMKGIREKRFAAEMAAASSCGDRNDISKDEVDAFIKKHKVPEGERKKEFVDCYLLATGLVRQDHRFNWNGLKARLAVMNGIHTDKLETIQDACKNAENVGKNDQERHFDIIECIITELSKEDEDESGSSESSEESDLF